MKPLIGTDLKRFVKQYRRAYPPERQVAALLQSVEYPYNVGAIFRLADGAGMSELLLTGITPQPPHPTLEKTARYKTQSVNWRYVADPVEGVLGLKQKGYTVVAVELAEGAVPYHEYLYPEQVALVVGHEDHGVTKAVLEVCDTAVFLPMYGKGLSLNVQTALSIVTYHALHAPLP
jgi:23S rRNA (guanosine2251-2'-O)-methyltransferase